MFWPQKYKALIIIKSCTWTTRNNGGACVQFIGDQTQLWHHNQYTLKSFLRNAVLSAMEQLDCEAQRVRDKSCTDCHTSEYKSSNIFLPFRSSVVVQYSITARNSFKPKSCEIWFAHNLFQNFPVVLNFSRSTVVLCKVLKLFENRNGCNGRTRFREILIWDERRTSFRSHIAQLPSVVWTELD